MMAVVVNLRDHSLNSRECKLIGYTIRIGQDLLPAEFTSRLKLHSINRWICGIIHWIPLNSQQPVHSSWPNNKVQVSLSSKTQYLTDCSTTRFAIWGFFIFFQFRFHLKENSAMLQYFIKYEVCLFASMKCQLFIFKIGQVMRLKSSCCSYQTVVSFTPYFKNFIGYRRTITC